MLRNIRFRLLVVRQLVELGRHGRRILFFDGKVLVVRPTKWQVAVGILRALFSPGVR